MTLTRKGRTQIRTAQRAVIGVIFTLEISLSLGRPAVLGIVHRSSPQELLMSLADLASLGSFISGIAVLVSLVYLAQQIRQSTKHSRCH
jgi:hypothetical protein